ncbi:MAG: hypothetical protein ACRDP5_20285 [Streptosporangiaceae bacterium]
MSTHTGRRPLLRRAALASCAVTASCAVLAACTAAPHKGPDTDVTAPAVGRPPAPASAQAALSSEAFTPYAGLGAVDNDGLAPGDTYDALHTACMNDAGYGQYASQAPYSIRTNRGFTFASPYGWQGYIGTALAAQQGFLAGSPLLPGGGAPAGGSPSAPFAGMPAGAEAAAGKCFNILENFNNAQLAHSMAIIETLNNDIGNDEVADGSIKKAMANWSACMAKNGYRTSNANTFSQQAQVTLGLRPPPGPNPGPFTPSGQPTAAQNKAQIAMAVADADCTLSSDLAGIYFAVQGSYEQQFVSANQQALNAGVRAYKAAFAKTLKALPVLLRTTSVTPNLPGPPRPGHHGGNRGTAKPSPSHS